MSLDDFEFGRILGKGVFGSVIVVKRKKDQEIYAMKRVKIYGLTKRELENSFNEVRLLASLDHKNVIGYREAFYDQNSTTLNIVMEFADDGDLSTKIKESLKNKNYFDEYTIWSTLIQILEGLKYLHNSDIIHRDLKSANIFLTKKGIVKIGDLNVSKIIGKNMAITQTGTPYYSSPEVWNDNPYNYKCDIWSAGCIIYEMSALKLPFRGTSMQALYSNVMKGEFDPLPFKYSDDLFKIITLMLAKNPKKRPSAEELLNNEIILDKIEKYGFNEQYDNCIDEKALLMRTIKLPRNLNQMNQVNNQLPKNYKKEIIKNRKEMLENDEYETAKNSFYQEKEKNKSKKKKKNFGNLSSIQVEYDDCKKKKKSIKKAITENELNNIISQPKINVKKYKNNLYYNYSINNINKQKNKGNDKLNKNILIYNNENKENFNINRKKKNEKDILKKISQYLVNKKENIFSPKQKIIEGKRYHFKNQNRESLRISTSNIYTTEEEKNKYYKIKTTINEPIKLLRNSCINNSMKNNFYLNKDNEERKNNKIEQIKIGNSLYNNKKISIPSSISTIQQQSRQRKYMNNPILENELKNKNLKTINCDKDKYNSILFNKKKKEKKIARNKSCKGNIKISNNLIFNDEKIFGEKILKRKKRINQNNIRRNISTDFIDNKISIHNNHNKNLYRNNSHIVNNRNSAKDNNSNNHRLKRIKNQLEELVPTFEIEKLYKKRLPSANIGKKKKNNNVNVKININNNYNYINNLNIENSHNKFITENPMFNYENYHNKLMRPKSTSSIMSENRQINKNNNLHIKKGGKFKELNINDISDNYLSNKNDSEKKYNKFYNVYFQKYIDNKKKISKNRITISNHNKYIKSMNNGYNSNDCRKIIYEKIHIIKNGKEGIKYIKGPSIIKNIRNGNENNKKETLKYQNLLKNNNSININSKDFSLQNFIKKEFQEEKIGKKLSLINGKHWII